MGKVGKFFKAIGLIISNPYLLNNVLDDSEVNKEIIINEHNLGNGLPVVDLLHMFPSFEDSINPFTFLDGTSQVIDLAVLKSIAAKIENCDYLEIGSWRGESVVNVADTGANCVVVNLPKADMIAMGLNKDYIENHHFFYKNNTKIKIVDADSTKLDFSSLNQKFDLIFVDGSHHYEDVKSDSINAFELLKDENSIIIWHDYLNNSASVRWEVFRGIIEGTPEPKRNKLTHISNTLFAMYNNHKYPSHEMNFFAEPNKSFEVNIKATAITE